jgi:hypothetical protein
MWDGKKTVDSNCVYQAECYKIQCVDLASTTSTTGVNHGIKHFFAVTELAKAHMATLTPEGNLSLWAGAVK